MISLPAQPTIDDLGTPLAHVTFCVVDLETTGGGLDDRVTEIGAVTVRGGAVLGEFQTLVNPRTHIPPLIAVLTGITDSMVADAPRLSSVLPGFLEFSRRCVLVAHNAGFDIGFLKRACAEFGYEWPNPTVIDTVSLARQALLRDEVRNHKLATLAQYFRAATAPDHRALTDARATVTVLHGLLERVGNLGVHTVEDLLEFTRRVSPQRRAKRTWAADLPRTPGVYWFVADGRDAAGRARRQVLYVGKSRNLAARVRSYFTAAETRPRIDEMVRVSTGVEHLECRTELEAEVLELRLIAAHAPRYNRRSKFPERRVWLKLTREPFPRLSIVRQCLDDGADYFGPFSRRSGAESVRAALYDAFPIRQCTTRLSPRRPSSACVLGELGKCLAPCQLAITPSQYGELVDQVRASLTTDIRPVLTAAQGRLATLIQRERFEDAAVVTARLSGFATSALRHHRVASLARCPQIVAAYRQAGNWEIHVIRYGRLAATARARPGDVPQAVARAAIAAAEHVEAPVAPQPAATIEETERIAAWLERPGVRLIEIEGQWSWPLHIGLADGELARHALPRAAPAAGAETSERTPDPIVGEKPILAGRACRDLK
ncbi:DEDD exonuclease domain-containing protein [Micropruina sp.]|uniref:DEDD exonuclease domain-containing protein n=1 Tax=Micropruina sp. TaxID=2737536 RepID=UPI0039E6208E